MTVPPPASQGHWSFAYRANAGVVTRSAFDNVIIFIILPSAGFLIVLYVLVSRALASYIFIGRSPGCGPLFDTLVGCPLVRGASYVVPS